MPQLDSVSYVGVFIVVVMTFVVMHVLCSFYMLPFMLRNVYVRKRVLARESLVPWDLEPLLFMASSKIRTINTYKMTSFGNRVFFWAVVLDFKQRMLLGKSWSGPSNVLWASYLCKYLLMVNLLDMYDSLR